MNILPKKKWHVRTKENMARVRRDEANAANEEAKKQERVRIAENEDRLSHLRGVGASSTTSSTFHIVGSSDIGGDGRSHINFFAAEERMINLESRNKEADADAKKELDDHEHKLGIKVKFGDLPSQSWYEKAPERPYLQRDKVEKEKEKDRKEKEEKERKEMKKKKKDRRRKRSRSLSDPEDETKRKKSKLAKLREERLQREREEKRREFDLLHPEVKQAREEAKRRQTETTYSSQFNPHIAKQNKYKN